MQVYCIGDVPSRIRFVVAHMQPLMPTQEIDQRHRDPWITVPQHPQVPETVLPAERRRKSVHGKQQRLRADSSQTGERHVNRVMVWPVEALRSRLLLGYAEILVAGDDGAIACLEDRLGIAGLAVTVEQQPRIAGEHRWRAKALGQQPGESGRADIVGDMTAQRILVETEVVDRRRNGATGVIADQQDGCRRFRVEHLERRRVVRSDQRWRRGFAA